MFTRPIPHSTLLPRGTSLPSSRNVASPAHLISTRFALLPLRAIPLSRLAANRATNDREWIFLLLFYGSSGLRDTSLQQVRLDGHFLTRKQVDLRFESLVSGKGNLDAVFSGADEHPMSHPAEFGDRSRESVVNKNRSPFWRDFQLDERSNRWQASPRVLQHDNLHLGFLVRFHDDLLREIRIPCLTNGNLMFAGH